MGESTKENGRQPDGVGRLGALVYVKEWATIVVAVILLCQATNSTLSGGRFLLAVMLACCGVGLTVECVRRLLVGERLPLVGWVGMVVALGLSLLVVIWPTSTAGVVANEWASKAPSVRSEGRAAKPMPRKIELYPHSDTRMY